MKKGLTELVFILDRSGSMAGLESDTIGGFNATLDKQRQVEGEAIVTTVLFDDKYELLHDRIPLVGVAPMTKDQYYVRGCTALLDAVGRTIEKIVNVQRNTAQELQAEKVIFVITTDGLENASREYNYARIRRMISHQQEKYGWEFIFLGANMDAVAEGAKMGIREDRTANYACDKEGIQAQYSSVAKFLVMSRCCEATPGEEWKEDIETDRRRRRR